MSEKRIMDQETREKLYGLLPFSKKSTSEYKPSLYGEDISDEYKPIFSIRPFSRDEVKEAKKVLKEIEKSEKEDDLGNLSRKAVVGWKHLYDVGTGDEIEYVQDPEGGADKELYEIIPVTLKAMILVEAIKISGLLDLSKLGLKS